MPQNSIHIRGAREHNLKNIDLVIPRDKLVVFTGLSGSGKSSLAFDTLFAEGQRRYIESLSSYARQFLGQMEKPDVDHIDGLSPAISIDQKSASHNPRSTVGTVTEIYDYMRLLYARIGQPHCPICGRPVSAQTVQQMADAMLDLPEGTRVMLLSPIVKGRKGEYRQTLEDLRKSGYARVRVDGVTRDLSDPIDLDKNKKHTIEVVVDRLVIHNETTDDSAEHLPANITYLQPAAPLAKVAEEPQEYTLSVSPEHANGHYMRPLSLADTLDSEDGAAAAEVRNGTETTPDEPHSMRQRVTDSIETTLKAGNGVMIAAIVNTEGKTTEERLYSEKFACEYCNFSIDEIAPRTFSFNNPHGACSDCTGLGYKLVVDEELLVINPDLTLDEGALGPWITYSGTSQWYAMQMSALRERYGFTARVRWKDMTATQQRVILYGDPEELKFRYRNQMGQSREYSARYEGVVAYVKQRHAEGSDHMRAEMEKYMTERVCPTCHGKKLRPEALGVTVSDKNIQDLTAMPVLKLKEFFANLQESERSDRERIISTPILKEILARLGFLVDVGLDYLTLSRSANTLSGGEAQRIRLATQIGSGLTGVLYILDEPSIGLHQRDNERLIQTLKRLRDLGNTLIVVEHDEETMRDSDYIVDIGPGAGDLGGKVVAQGTYEEIIQHPESITGKYLSRRLAIAVPEKRRPGNGKKLVINGAREHNLKNITVEIPLGKLVVVTGVSGSGKSSLVNSVIYPKLATALNGARRRAGEHDSIIGVDALDKVIDIDQSPIGRTPRSNPATYTNAFTAIRDLFAQTAEARARGYTPGRFSFNVKGGRCETCQGEGIIKIEMNFLPDVYVPCEACHGKRYNREALEIRFKGKTIADVLDMTIETACDFFAAIPSIYNKFSTLRDVGLNYMTLGQPATTLSGGEAQRVKLAAELSRRSTGKTLYILDEPTTGLHFADVERLLHVLQRLTDAGNTVLVIEHNLDVIKCADWIIDLGPEGGDRGGTIIAQGAPEEIVECNRSYTGMFLRRLLEEKVAGAV